MLCVAHCVSRRVFLLTPFHLVNVDVTLLIIPEQTAVRAPAEVVGLKLDIFHLKDYICLETDLQGDLLQGRVKLISRGQ